MVGCILTCGLTSLSLFFVSDHVLAEVSEITAATDLPNVTSHVAGVINNTYLLSDAISAN